MRLRLLGIHDLNRNGDLLERHGGVSDHVDTGVRPIRRSGLAANWRVTADWFTDKVVTVWYRRSGVRRAAVGHTDDVHVDNVTDPPPDQARTLAVALSRWCGTRLSSGWEH